MDASLEREKEVFDAALALEDVGQRRAYLAGACAGDAVLRARVERLLATHERADQFFAGCVAGMKPVLAEAEGGFEQLAGADVPDEEIGRRIGNYKLLQRIGEGGCGTVYMAEQEKPVRRRVALKIIKLGMDTRSVIARFEAERQALALMDHPNIAHVLDAGVTETGRSYFVMELINGIKITNYCDEGQLDTRQRLNLFIQVCHAIQHAHQKGIIHRDIKPSNILVTHHDGVPVPKVIDFGIAKATQEPLTDKTLFTIYGHFVGTPAYMSPEQAEMSGLDVDTRSDIYSLGVLLYELLTSKTPFDQKELMESGLDEMRRMLREREPHRPSTKLDTLPVAELTTTALRRHSEPPKLQSLLRGDLDWIVMKALEKDRRRRYETANGLAMDVLRYLHNEPVAARPPSRIYRFQKLVRRNQALFAGIGAVAVTLVIGLGTSTWLFFRERDARQMAVVSGQRAEQARLNEERLRRDAENREKVTQATLFLSKGRLGDADRLAETLPFDKPTLEGAAVLRSLGEWHALGNRWPQAAERFGELFRMNHLDGWDIATLDVLGCAAALAQTADAERFDRFREGIARRFANEQNPIVIERVLKAALLLPADEHELQDLEPLARAVIPKTAVSIGDSRALTTLWRQNFSANPRVHSNGGSQPEGSDENAPAKLEAPPRIPGAAGDVFGNPLQKHVLMNIGTDRPFSMQRNDGMITMVAGGANVWEKADEFVYACALMAGDFDFRMRVVSITPRLDDFTRVGLMARESMSQGSRHVMVTVNAENSFQVLTRPAEGADATSVPQNPLPAAYGSNSWVRLQRVNAIFHAYTSSNGVDWVQLYQTTGGDKPFTDPIHFGIAASAHSATDVATNIVSDPGVTPTVPVNVAVTLALLEFRRGNCAGSAEWCRRALAYPECDAVRVATARAILAMACARLGQLEEARAEVSQARSLIQDKFPDGLELGSEAKGFWFDWAVAGTLLREAATQVR